MRCVLLVYCDAMQGAGRRRSLILAAAIAPSVFAQTFVTDVSQPGTSFNPGVHGQAAPDLAINRGDEQVGIPKALAVSNGSSIRGIAGGLEAELFNWKTRNNSPRPGTLDFLRYARDRKADLFITA